MRNLPAVTKGRLRELGLEMGGWHGRVSCDATHDWKRCCGMAAVKVECDAMGSDVTDDACAA